MFCSRGRSGEDTPRPLGTRQNGATLVINFMARLRLAFGDSTIRRCRRRSLGRRAILKKARESSQNLLFEIPIQISEKICSTRGQFASDQTDNISQRVLI